MNDEKKWHELIQAEDEAYFKGDLVLSLPEGFYSAEEMWDVVMDMFRTSIAVEQEMRREFEQKCKELHFCSKAWRIDCKPCTFAQPNTPVSPESP